MSTGDTWHDDLALAPLSNKASTGSYDSVITLNSVCSEDSMEHLSAEERACIMYLEQTIEALEVQEDSGLSNDEPDSGSLLKKMGLNSINDTSAFDFESGMEKRPETLPAVPVGFPLKESDYITLTKENRAEDHLLNQTYEPNHTVAPEASTDGLTTSTTSKFISRPHFQVTDSVTDSNIPLDTKGLCSSTIGDSSSLTLPSVPDNPYALDMDVGLIPPPSDFMDDPVPDSKFTDLGPEFVLENDPKPNSVKAPFHSKYSIPVSADLKGFYQNALKKNPSVSPSTNQRHPDKLPIITRPSLPALEPVLPVILHPDSTELKIPPFVAPKPKRSSIKMPYHMQTSEPNSPIGNGDRQLSDQDIVHIQALQKLGLLKDLNKDLDPTLNHKLSPQTRKSWADLPSACSPSLLRPSNRKSSFIASSHASLGSPSTTSAPSSFTERSRHRLSHRETYPTNDVLTSSTHTQVKSPRLTSSDLIRQLKKVPGAQSGAVEHSDLQLSQPTAHQDRNSVERYLSHADSHGFRRRSSYNSALQHPGGANNLRRSHGISVLISPRDENGVDPEALKKLGTKQTLHPS
ncbi:specifically androgen-regulated gene protein-like [Corythoichthys intestinalis]|uniref:specifically androgen-regulated gene protein-like n=1 Tax=Corythoichthys intestinalis TaxID=161448 RepID=UPI0025A584B5|nr:specifically androgen-regulated gene protein-like [Corythoichthys intestinalis]XP_057685722.1 specifically androgen-regulated gene protein-like [Corythoichthys intestinalis]XP_061802989.1 specifically androgen-regulated gene protein-like [Nerophis lumbriciformis]